MQQERLESIILESLEKHQVSKKKILSIAINDDSIRVIIEVDKPSQYDLSKIENELIAKLKNQTNEKQVLISFTALSETVAETKKDDKNFSVKHVIAFASGKGGVGKSTTAFQYALGLVDKGYKVGFLDADIYGPSFPVFFPDYEKPAIDENKLFIPLEKKGLKVNSIGFHLDHDEAAIWRGPMASKAITQLFYGTKWEELDFLIIDLPPGTGDIHLTLCQKMPLSGVVIVTTPQDLALIDAMKAQRMFQKINVPILGWIENMSHFICPHCDEPSHIFERGVLFDKLESPCLAQIPLTIDLRHMSDKGLSVFSDEKGAPLRKHYEQLIEQSLTALQ